MAEASYTYEQKKALSEKLDSMPPSSRTKEIYALIQDYARKTSNTQTKRLGNKGTTPFGARKVGDDYVFEINNLPPPLLQMIEKVLETE
jgi:hypothetical protein